MWDPIKPVDFETGTARATLGEVHDAAREADILGRNSNASLIARERAYDERSELIKSAFGVEIENPISAYQTAWNEWKSRHPFLPVDDADAENRSRIWTESHERYRAAIEDLHKKYPDAFDLIGVEPDIREPAARMAREAEERAGVLAASRDDLLTYGALFTGGFAAAIRDPLQAPLFLLGGGPGAARTVAGRILTVAAKEGAISGLSEAALQPFVQDWRRQAGLSHGLGDAAEAVGFATVLGGLFGGGFRGLYEGGAAGARALRARREPPAAIRGAADELEADAAWRESRPRDVPDGADDLAASRALEVAEDPEAFARLGERIGPTFREEAAHYPDGDGGPAPGRREIDPADDILGYDRQFGPEIDARMYQLEWPKLVERMKGLRSGIARGALYNPETGPIDVVWGKHRAGRRQSGYGLAKIAAKHPEMIDDLPETVARMDVARIDDEAAKVELNDGERVAVIQLRRDEDTGGWLLTAYDRGAKPPEGDPALGRRAGRTYEISGGHQAGSHSSPASPPRPIGQGEAIAEIGIEVETRAFEPETDGPAQAEILDAEARIVERPPAPERFGAIKLEKPKVRRPTSLLSFLAGSGIRDEGGELSHMGLSHRTMFGPGKPLVRKSGMTLDHAREVAAEAGYMHNHGPPEMAMQTTTTGDLLDLIAEEAGGSKVYSEQDFDAVRQWAEYDGLKADREEWLRHEGEIRDAAGADLPEEFVTRAADLRMGEGMEIEDALERAIMEDYYGFGDPPLERADGSTIEVPDDDPFSGRHAPQRDADPQAGGDEAGARPATAGAGGEGPRRAGGDEGPAGGEAREGLDDTPDDYGDLEVVDLVVDEDGTVSATTRPLGEAIAAADRDQHLADVLDACKVF